ncbi:MAG: hypothetical protein GY726_09205, partial [Proteobacteria bacterium]|nr:hypothetical protein [Pseudomonadota bacterium]
MSALKQIDLNEAPCPIDEAALSGLNHSSPGDAALIAGQLPLQQRAILCQFCYEKAHLFELALRIASTLDLPTLTTVFGKGAPVVFEQSRDIASTLAEVNRRALFDAPAP